MKTVDLRSDTVTRPTPEMRQAMAQAEVGDDVFGEDPTVNLLEERVAKMLGKEAALFVASGTMANLVGTMAQTRHGDSMILCRDAHPLNHESGNISAIAGVMPRPVDGRLGIITADEIASAIVKSNDAHFSPTTLISIENTTNRGGGAIYPLEVVKEIGDLAKEKGMRVHCDGARIFNAVVESGISVKEYASHVDTLTFCFSKALGCPVGSIITGDRETIHRAHRFRKMLGGGMRQVGILAAAALYALDHNIDRLKEDHRRTRELREALEDVPGIAIPLPSATNILYIDVKNATSMVKRLARKGVLVLPTSKTRIRAVFHLDVDDGGLAQAIEAFKSSVEK
jgi:threonine aldolase